MEPPALEEGILECYPIFLDIVLDQISSDSIVFSHAVTCLKLLFEMLGRLTFPSFELETCTYIPAPHSLSLLL